MMESAMRPVSGRAGVAPTDAAEMDDAQEREWETFEGIMALLDPAELRRRMLALTWQEFERFVRYVFECAGYEVELVSSDHKHHHVDLRLYEGTAAVPVALVEVRHLESAVLKHQAVAAFIGNLALAGATRGYLVTTSTFTRPAREAAAQAEGRGYGVCLTDWRHLARYISYLHGSRGFTADGRQRTSRPTPPDWLNVADALPRRDPRQTTILAIANNRGGVAKTTSALSLALALVQQRKKVLLVDLDGQASLTLALPPPGRGHPPEGRVDERTIVDYFAGRAPLVDRKGL